MLTEVLAGMVFDVVCQDFGSGKLLLTVRALPCPRDGITRGHEGNLARPVLYRLAPGDMLRECMLSRERSLACHTLPRHVPHRGCPQLWQSCMQWGLDCSQGLGVLRDMMSNVLQPPLRMFHARAFLSHVSRNHSMG